MQREETQNDGHKNIDFKDLNVYHVTAKASVKTVCSANLEQGIPDILLHSSTSLGHSPELMTTGEG